MDRLVSMRSFDDGVDAWEFADASPSQALAGAVGRYCWWRENTASFDTRRELASTCGVFIVNLGAPLEIADVCGKAIQLGAGQAFIGGMAQGTSLSRSTGVMEGIHIFMPVYELARAMGVSMSDLADRTLLLDEALGREADELGDRMLACASTNSRLDLLDAFMTRRLGTAAESDGTIAHVIKALRAGSVSAAAEDLGWSRKRLAAWFCDRTGIRPAQFTRLARFERFTDAMQREIWASLAELAYDAGYADQAHLTHEVRRFAGTTPGALRAQFLPAGGGVRG